MPAATPSYFDTATGGDLPESNWQEQAAWLIEQVALAAEISPVWCISGGRFDGVDIRLAVVERMQGKVRVAMQCDRWRGELRLDVDEGGWVRAELGADGKTVFTAFADRPYEEIRLSAQTRLADDTDALAGRMGKRLNWISLPKAPWPMLSEIADGEWFNAEAAEDDLVPDSI